MSGAGAQLPFMAVSAFSSIATGYSQSKALKSEGSYQKQVADTNATMADMAGEQTIEAGDIAAGRKDLETRQKVGSILATQGASGVDVSSGSARLVRSAVGGVGAMDELTIRNNASRAAFGYKIKAIQDRSSGEFAELNAKNKANQSLLSGVLGAISSPLKMQSDYMVSARRSGVGGTDSIPSNGYVDTGDMA